jgi:tRNA (guanosine-2'-O-)-methyltransferase
MHTERRRERLIQAAHARQQGAVVLQDIHDPHNAEAVFRSMDALGFQRVCLVFEQGEPFNPRRIGKVSSASANKWLSFETYDSTAACLTRLKAEGYETVATVLSPDAESLFRAEFHRPRTALMFGNEHRGLSSEAVELADRRLMIPMRGLVQSFNLSVTAALCLFELTRQRQARGLAEYLLPADEREALAAEFLARGS